MESYSMWRMENVQTTAFERRKWKKGVNVKEQLLMFVVTKGK
jgi:hypothetical protein